MFGPFAVPSDNMASRIQVWSGVPGRKVVTVSHEGDPVDPGCAGCSAPCCRCFSPILSVDEAKSGRYTLAYVPFPKEGVGETDLVPPPDARVVVVAKKTDGSCVHQGPDGRCLVHNHRPKSCSLYDCRRETRGALREFVLRRFHPEVTT